MERNKRVVIIGLDGVPHTLISGLMEKGLMPELTKITARGVLKPMNAVLPEVSCVSWSSFMTGANPAEHGIFGFMNMKPGTYDICFPKLLAGLTQIGVKMPAC